MENTETMTDSLEIQEKKSETEPLLESESSSKSNLNFNASYVEGKEKTYTSVTDLYGINVFTDSFAKKAEMYKKDEQEFLNNIGSQIFLKEIKNDDGEIEEVKSLLFSDQWSLALKDQQVKDKDNGMGITIIAIAIMFSAFILFLINYIDTKKRKGEKEIVNDNLKDYE